MGASCGRFPMYRWKCTLGNSWRCWAPRAGGKPGVAPGPDRGIVFQHFALFPWKTVRGNILYGLERQGMPRLEREQRAQDFINMVGLRGFEESYPSQLSGGMKQRTAIARTLAFGLKF